MKKILTLCLIHNHPHVLLGMKKRGFGAGRWAGFGGKVEEGETIEEAAMREMEEEVGIRAAELTHMGVLAFEFAGNPEILEVHIFKARDFDGDPAESEEMRPQWFHVAEIPFDEMWPDGRYWIPHFLKDKKFRGGFLFGENDAILEQELTLVDEL